jgi:hypothetical protein
MLEFVPVKILYILLCSIFKFLKKSAPSSANVKKLAINSAPIGQMPFDFCKQARA